jgi:ADP-ribose pyrophosphatase
MMARKRSETSGKVKKSAGVKIISSRTVFRGPVFTVVSDKVREPGGITARRDVIRHSGSVVVLAVDEARNRTNKEPRVLLERQYRYAAKDYLWELPAGRIDPGENELTGAKRELLEETGYTASSWKPILKFYVSPGFLDETMVIYLARGLRAGKAQPEEDELISVKFWPLSAALRMIERHVIRDAKTITGLLWLASQKMRKSSSTGQFGPVY